MHRFFVTSFNAEVVLASFVGFELRTGFAWVAGLWVSRELYGRAMVRVMGLQWWACGGHRFAFGLLSTALFGL
jgi:hypothetical protein